MILIDVNLLLYATNKSVSQHAAAREWLDERLSDVRRVGLPWATLLGFLRLATSARIAARPLTIATAWKQVAQWFECEPVWIPQPTERHPEVLGKLLAEPAFTAILSRTLILRRSPSSTV